MVVLRGMGRRRKMAAAVAGCIAVLAVFAWLVWPRDEPSRATVDEAVRAFRADGDPGRHGDKPGGPALGVYRYATRGGESVDSPVLDTTHDYGGVSTIVLSAGRCAERERWQVLDGRWSEVELCAGPHGKTTGTVTEFHEFFGVGQEDTFQCRGGTTTLRPDTRAAGSCRSDDSSISTNSRVIGAAAVHVGGAAFETTQIVSHSVFGGADSGTAERREWRRRSDGLLLRRTVRSEVDSSAAGGTHYSERYSIRLLSTRPRR